MNVHTTMAITHTLSDTVRNFSYCIRYGVLEDADSYDREMIHQD
jgi:hypothetical protein